MSGDRNVIIAGICVLALAVLESAVFACPACSVSDPDAKTKAGQTFWVLSAMGIIPLVAAALVGYSIVRLSRREQNP